MGIFQSAVVFFSLGKGNSFSKLHSVKTSRELCWGGWWCRKIWAKIPFDSPKKQWFQWKIAKYLKTKPEMFGFQAKNKSTKRTSGTLLPTVINLPFHKKTRRRWFQAIWKYMKVKLDSSSWLFRGGNTPYLKPPSLLQWIRLDRKVHMHWIKWLHN